MPTYVTGNMWDVFNTTDWFLITTNPVINKRGLAVMGRGIAKEAADRFPAIRKDFAEQLTKLGESGYLRRPVRTIGKYDGTRIGWFMVKHHWRSPAEPKLIESACCELADIVTSLAFLRCVPKDFRVDLNFPGIGNGGLPKGLVRPILDRHLPSNVFVWGYEQEDS